MSSTSSIVGRRRVHERAAGAQHLEGGGDAAHPERRQQRHGAVVAGHEEDRRECPRLGRDRRTGRAPRPSASPCCPRCRRRTRRRPATPPARPPRAARRRARCRPSARARSSSTGRAHGDAVGVVEPDRPEVRRARQPQRAARRRRPARVVRPSRVSTKSRRRKRRTPTRICASLVRRMCASSGGVASVLIGRDQRADAQRGVERRQPAATPSGASSAIRVPLPAPVASSACGHRGRAAVELVRSVSGLVARRSSAGCSARVATTSREQLGEGRCRSASSRSASEAR